MVFFKNLSTYDAGVFTTEFLVDQDFWLREGLD